MLTHLSHRPQHHLSSPEFQALGAQIPTLTTGLFAKWTKVAK